MGVWGVPRFGGLGYGFFRVWVKDLVGCGSQRVRFPQQEDKLQNAGLLFLGVWGLLDPCTLPGAQELGRLSTYTCKAYKPCSNPSYLSGLFTACIPAMRIQVPDNHNLRGPKPKLVGPHRVFLAL